MDNLNQKAKQAVYWTTGFNFFRDVLQFAVMIVLVRIIPPEAYGQFGLVTSIIGFISIFSFYTFIAHSLQIRKIEEIDYQSHFTAGLFIQLTVIIITIIVAVILSFSETYKSVSWPIAIMSLTFAIALPGELKVKQFEKQLDWKRLRILHGIGIVFASLLSIAMALMGFGVYALLIPGLFNTVPFIYYLFFIDKWKPDFTFNRTRYSETIKFGLPQIGSGLTVRLQPLIESTWLTSAIGFYSFGIYGRAFGLARMFTEKFTSQLLYSAYPIITNIDENSQQFRNAVNTILLVILIFLLPVTLIFSLKSAAVITLIYGNKWLEVIPLMPYAMAIISLIAFNNALNTVLLACNKQNFLFIVAVINVIVNVSLLVFILRYGLFYYLGGLVILQFALVAIGFYKVENLKLLEGKKFIENVLIIILVTSTSYLPVYFLEMALSERKLMFDVLLIILYLFLFTIVFRVFSKQNFIMVTNYFPFNNKIKQLYLIHDK